MQSKHLSALAGLSLLIFSACSTVHQASNSTTILIPTKTSHSASATKKNTMVGPPEYIPDTVAKKKNAAPKIIEKGGKYVFIPPAYTMRKAEKGNDKYSLTTLQLKAKKIKAFAAANNYDTTVAFFIDMQVKSGKDRFMVVDLANNTIIKKGLVAHGKGNEKFTFDRKFSNDEGSNCTSLGLYKIGKAYNGAFGLSYKLYGLNKTNSNALKRYVVLHAMGSIPNEESLYPITQTEGCPAVSPEFLDQLAGILDNSTKRILLYIYYGNN